MNNTFAVKRMSIAKQSLYALLAVCAAVILPQICHVAGTALGVKSAIGEMLLPMHLPVLLVGFLAGGYAGAAAGILSPLISFALTAMPSPALLPFMVIELAVYGLCAGLLRETKIPAFFKVLIAQISGRLVRAAAILIAFKLELSAVSPAIILSSIAVGLAGIAIQLVVIPLIVSRQER